jgi:hypothetical protein
MQEQRACVVAEKKKVYVWDCPKCVALGRKPKHLESLSESQLEWNKEAHLKSHEKRGE